MQEIGKDSINVLGILQNYYAGPRYRNKRIPTPYPSWHYAMINRKNATYSRLIKYCEERNIKLWFTECTDVIAGERDDKFTYKPDVVRHSIQACEWNAIIAFGSHAKFVLNSVLEQDHKHNVFYLSHPVSFKWRKQSYLDTLDAILKQRKV